MDDLLDSHQHRKRIATGFTINKVPTVLIKALKEQVPYEMNVMWMEYADKNGKIDKVEFKNMPRIVCNTL